MPGIEAVLHRVLGSYSIFLVVLLNPFLVFWISLSQTQIFKKYSKGHFTVDLPYLGIIRNVDFIVIRYHSEALKGKIGFLHSNQIRCAITNKLPQWEPMSGVKAFRVSGPPNPSLCCIGEAITQLTFSSRQYFWQAATAFRFSAWRAWNSSSSQREVVRTISPSPIPALISWIFQNTQRKKLSGLNWSKPSITTKASVWYNLGVTTSSVLQKH